MFFVDPRPDVRCCTVRVVRAAVALRWLANGSAGVLHSSEQQTNFLANALSSGDAGFSRRRAGEVVVIVPANNPVVALRCDQVEDILLAERRRFPHGGTAVMIEQAIGAGARDAFYLGLAAKSPAPLKAHRAKMVFPGRARRAKEAGGNAVLRKLSAANADLIGYIGRDAPDDSVKTVLVLR